MAEYTLLDYVQTILSSMDSDEVNAYDDTVESIQVANIVKTVYNQIQARADLPEHYTLFELDSAADAAYPVLMTKPNDVSSILWIKYNKIEDGDTAPLWSKVNFLPLDQFLNHTLQFDLDDTTVDSMTITAVNADTLQFLFKNDAAPKYFTTFDDSKVIFDSYDSEVDTTLERTKTLCYGRKDQSFTMSDTFVPFLDRDLSTLLLNESKVLAFSELKQVGHDVAKQWANRGWVKMQKTKRGIDQERNELDRAPNYGRK